MGLREDLTRAEDEAWNELCETVDGLGTDELDRPGVTPEGWSIKDTVWHIGCWLAEAARQLERVHQGTYADQEWDTDGLNTRFLVEGRELDLASVKSHLTAARQQMLRCWGELEEITPDAAEWFEESGPIHIRDHLADIRGQLERLKG